MFSFLQEDLTKETLHKQYQLVKSHTNTSHVMQYGNKVSRGAWHAHRFLEPQAGLPGRFISWRRGMGPRCEMATAEMGSACHRHCTLGSLPGLWNQIWQGSNSQRFETLVKGLTLSVSVSSLVKTLVSKVSRSIEDHASETLSTGPARVVGG